MHTPGPWFVRRNRNNTCFYIENDAQKAGPGYTAQCDHWTNGKASCPTKDEAEANAHLIASAPEMNAALLVAEDTLLHCVAAGPGCDDEIARQDAIRIVRAAIARAKGDS